MNVSLLRLITKWLKINKILQKYACLNKYVLRCFLKISMSVRNLISSGMEFYSIGAATLYEYIGNVLHLVLGISNIVVLADLRPSLVGCS